MNKAVIGLGYGDEGKGQVTDYLASSPHYPLVVRYCGGHQAGHTVIANGVRHVFSNFGSGTIRYASTYWMRHCTVSPVGVFNEFQELTRKGLTPLLYIDKDCPIVTPYDKTVNRTNDKMLSNGTCGLGFGTTLQREENFYHLQYLDLFNPFIFKMKLEAIKTYYGYSGCPQTDTITEFLKCCEFMVENIPCVDETKMENVDLLFEGAQGLMLDQDIGFFPHVTRSNTGSKRIRQYDPKYYLVTRAYQTRHGAGPMSNENLPHNIKKNPDETNVFNEWQRDFRIALLDVDMLEYAIKKDNLEYSKPFLCITCLEHVRNDYRFTRHGQIVYCRHEREFCTKIAKELKIDYVLGFDIIDGETRVTCY